MNAVLFYVVPQFRLTGSTINAIEYFLAGWEHNPELKLILINGTISFKSKLIKLMSERYDMTTNGRTEAIHNIEYISKHKLPSTIFDTVLVLDYVTIGETIGILRANKILVICEKHMKTIYYDKTLYNVEYYGEMPFHCYKDYDYRMKCLFTWYKKLKNVQSGTYVNAPMLHDLDKMMNEISYLGTLLPKPFIFKSKIKPEENLFEKFTHYLYYHCNKWFDPHPRLFLECRYYNKCITYINPHKLRDGSWYRYEDVIKNNLHQRTLNRNDEIIRQLI